MKFTTLATLSLAAFANAAMKCKKEGDVGDDNHFSYEITGTIPAGDAPGTCGGLWDNLKGQSACTASNAWCGSDTGGDAFTWRFHTPIGCTGEMVEAVWWTQTQNSFGGIDCP